MAITKIHAIRATVQAAVNYICDKDKTDDLLLISSFATSPESAADDFRFALSKTGSADKNLAYHLIQSFSPGEVSQEEAHDIGKELADGILKGSHSYILTTHIDKGHIHNHIVFCAADFMNNKKYHDCRQTYRSIRNLSDRLCKEHNLSVIEQGTGHIKDYKEWQSEKAGTSWKSKLRKDINATIKEAKSYDEFISLMQAKGYEIKDAEISESAHKYIGFRAPGQERWIRGRESSLGADFTKERIKERIEINLKKKAERHKAPYHPNSIIDTSEDKFKNSPRLLNWAERENFQLGAKIRSELAGKGLRTVADIDVRIESLHKQASTGKRTTAGLDKKKKATAEILYFARQYSDKKRYVHAYKKSVDPDRYYMAHDYDLHLAWGAEDILKKAGIDPETMNLKQLESEYKQLCSDRDKAYMDYKNVEKECSELTRLRDEYLTYLGEPKHEETRDIPKKDKNMSL